MTQEETTFDALCSEHGITCEATYGARRTPIDPDWKPAHSWTVKITMGDESLTADFHQGAAHSDAPTVADVLSCLVSDAASTVYVDSFEEWACDLGYDEDSRRAEAIYAQCCRVAVDVQALLGDLFERFTGAEH